jgi:hypothetical protein
MTLLASPAPALWSGTSPHAQGVQGYCVTRPLAAVLAQQVVDFLEQHPARLSHEPCRIAYAAW